MELSFSIAFLILGFIQGVFLVFVAFYHKAMKHMSHKLLGVFIIILTLATLGTFANHELEDFSNPLWLRLVINYFPYHFVVVAGPAAYLHSKCVLNPNHTLKKRDLLHFVPLVLELVPFLGFLMLMIGAVFGMLEIPEDGVFESLRFYQRSMEIPRIISLMIYMYLTWKLFNSRKKERGKEANEWVKILVIFGGVIIVLFFLSLIVFFSPLYDSVGKKYQIEVYMIYYPIVGFIYLLSLRLIFRQAPWFLSSLDLSVIWDQVGSDKDLLSNENQKLFKKLNDIIIDHIDDSNLTIEMIAYELNASRSKAINLIKNLTGETPLVYIKGIRMDYVRRLIETEKVKNSSEAAKAIGMVNATQFSKQYQKFFGEPPFRKST